MLLRCNLSAQSSTAFLQNPFSPLKNNILRESSFYQLGQSPKILRPKPHGLERTDSQTIRDFATRRKGMYFSTACWMGRWEFNYFVKSKTRALNPTAFVNKASQHVISNECFP